MKLRMEARELWDAVEYGDADFTDDRNALDAICSAVPEEMIPVLVNKKNAKEAWEAIRTLRIGDDRVRKATAQNLRAEYESIALRDGEAIEDFALRLSSMVQRLATLGDPEPDEKVVAKYLRVVRPRYKQLVISIETLLDISQLSIEEVTGRLKAADDVVPAPANTASGKLLLTEEQWVERYKKKSGELGRGGSGSGGRGKGRGKGRGRGTGGNGGSSSSRPPPDDPCPRCGKKGHWASDCYTKKKQQPAHQAHVAQEEELGTLMMAIASAQEGGQHQTPSPSIFPNSPPPPPPKSVVDVHLNEPKVFAVFDGSPDPDPARWILDTGASNHMSGSKAAFAHLDSGIHGSVRFGDGSTAQIEGSGTVLFTGKNGEHQTLSNVYYLPRITANIISVGQLDETGYQVLVEDGFMRIRDEERRLLAKIPRSPGRLYVLTVNIARPVCLAARADDEAWTWHTRFGHANFTALRKMARQELVRGMPTLNQKEQLCDACLAGKQRRAPFPQKALRRSPEPLQLLHGDLCGPITPATPSGNRYFLLLVDDYSRYMWIALLPSKDVAAAAIKNIQAAAERKSGKKLLALRTDRGGEFAAADFNDYCAHLGVRRELTAPYTPQQNGVVERRNQTVVGTARSMMKDKALPGVFWGEAVTTAVYLLNRTSCKANQGATPYELWTGSTPAVHHLRTFGCVAHVKVTTPSPKKLDDRSKRMVFVGYEPGSKAYRVYDPVTRRVHISRDIIFDETAQWAWSADQNAGHGEFVIEEADPGEPAVITTTVTSSAPASSASPTSPASTSPSPGNMAAASSPPSTAAVMTPSPGHQQALEFASPPESGFSDLLDADHDDEAPLRFRRVDNIIGESTPPGFVDRNLEEHLLLASDAEPTSFEEALKHEHWRHAMLDEMTSIEASGTWELVDPPRRVKPIGLKWVYKTKKDATGVITKHKARLVAKGYVQQQGIDFEEVFAPVARLESVRLLLAHAASQGWAVHHMDVKSAFLNGVLQEQVYVEQPPGFVLRGHENKVLHLVKALYGLRQAPRAWYAKLDSSMIELGFQRSSYEHAVYLRGTGDHRLVVGVYVDDLVITGGNNEDIIKFKEEMKSKFQMSDLGLLHYYLGLEVTQSEAGITICQSAYAAKILESAGLTGCNPSHTPMEQRLKLSKQSSAPTVDPTRYRSIVGSLRYLVNSRPDLAYAVGYVSRFMEKPTAEHLTAVKRVLRYVAGTLHYGCHYPRMKEARLVGYSDSDMAGDIDTRKSTTGVGFFLGGSIITWQSQKQRVVALSSCEAEYIAAATAACQGVWLARLLAELKGEEASPFSLKIDNESAIALSRNPVFHDRSKHIDVKFHYIRECVEENRVQLQSIKTEEQLADILTKALGRERFCELRSRLGVLHVKQAY
jgi:transposase InsO family protein